MLKKFMPFTTFSSLSLPRVKYMGGVLALLALGAVAYPAWSWLFAVSGIAAVAGFVVQSRRTEFDNKPLGAVLIGHDSRNLEEVLLDSENARQHMLVTGPNETIRCDYFINLLGNALYLGDGAILMSSDIDRMLYHRVHAACVAAGRDNDLLVLNFNSQSSVDVRSSVIRSHCFNPFETASVDELVQCALSLASDRFGGPGADIAVWKARATSLLTAVMPVLVFLREVGAIELTAQTVSHYLGLDVLIGIAAGDDRGSKAGIPVALRSRVVTYLQSLPGFDLERGEGEMQRQSVREQHGYLREWLVAGFEMLDARFADVVGSEQSDVALQDVFIRRRILLVILPDASDVSHALVGKMMLSSFKSFWAAQLGSSVQRWRWNGVKAFKERTPFMVLLNGFDDYMVTGMAILAAQVRALGLSMVFGVADIPGALRKGDRETKSIIANTTTKVFLSSEIPLSIGSTPGIDSAENRELRPNEAAMTFRDQFRIMRIDAFTQVPASYGRRFNELISFPERTSPGMSCPAGVLEARGDGGMNVSGDLDTTSEGSAS